MALGNYQPQHNIKVGKDIPCRNPQRSKALIGQPNVTGLIILGLPSHVVSFAINLDCQARLQTGEIKNEGARGMLTPELEAAWTLAEFAP